MSRHDLTQARLKELLSYDQETGVFRWVTTSLIKVRAGQEAGCVNADGYREIGIDGYKYKTSRLAWFYVTGVWPTGMVDHRDGVRTNNKWANLREADATINNQNRRRAKSTSKCGLLGVSFDANSGKWRAHIRVNGRNRLLGSFEAPEAAHAKYVEAKRELHLGCEI